MKIFSNVSKIIIKFSNFEDPVINNLLFSENDSTSNTSKTEL